MTIIKQPWIKIVASFMLAISLASNVCASTQTLPAFTHFDDKNIALNKAIMTESTNFAVNLALKTWAPLVYETLQDIKSEVRWQGQYHLLLRIAASLSNIDHHLQPQLITVPTQEDHQQENTQYQILAHLLQLSRIYPLMHFTVNQNRIVIDIKTPEPTAKNLQHTDIVNPIESENLSNSDRVIRISAKPALESALQDFFKTATNNEVTP